MARIYPKALSNYGKYLPFYELDDNYFPEEINLQDVVFLIWSISQLEMRKTKEIMLNPENITFLALGFRIMSVLDEEYEIAPENEYLQDFFIKYVDYEDFIKLRTAAAWLYYHSYLIAPYTEGQLDEIAKSTGKNEKYREAIFYTS